MTESRVLKLTPSLLEEVTLRLYANNIIEITLQLEDGTQLQIAPTDPTGSLILSWRTWHMVTKDDLL